MNRDNKILAMLSSLGIGVIVMFCFFAVASQQHDVAALQSKKSVAHHAKAQKSPPAKAKVELTKDELAAKRALLEL